MNKYVAVPSIAFLNALSGSEESSATLNSPSIMIYADEGASYRYVGYFFKDHFPDHDIRLVKGDNLRNTEWMNAQSGILIIPGITGENCPYYEQIGEQGRDNVRTFLERANNLLVTFCAGTYAIHEQIHYNLSGGGSKTRISPIALIAGKAEGPPQGLSIDPKEDFILTRITYQDAAGQDITVTLAHGNGPALDEESILAQNGQLLGRYSDVEGEPAAGFHMPIGLGRMIGLGTIPYFGPSNPTMHIGSEPSQKMLDMIESETGRHAYCNMLLGLIEHHNPFFRPVYYASQNMNANASPAAFEAVR